MTTATRRARSSAKCLSAPALSAVDPRVSLRRQTTHLPSVIVHLSYRMPASDFEYAGIAAGHAIDGRFDVAPTVPRRSGALEQWFDAHTDGNGVWKWRHYFDIYERHFAKFVGQEVHVLEIGIYSGGSLDMWRDYFGPRARLYGVDIAPEVNVYQAEDMRVLIGDQGNPSFWKDVLPSIPRLDIVIDDGGHMPEQQMVTLDAVLPVISPGGVYLCEDIHKSTNPFWGYINGLASALHGFNVEHVAEDWETRVAPNRLQRFVSSIHQYPYVAVIERSDARVDALQSERHGTVWQPFDASAHGVGSDDGPIWPGAA